MPLAQRATVPPSLRESSSRVSSLLACYALGPPASAAHDGGEVPARPSSFDYLVGAREQRRWHFEAESLRRFEIDRQVVLGRCLHRQVGRLLALEDAASVGVPNNRPAPFDIFWLKP